MKTRFMAWTACVVLTFSANANAEFLIGGDVGYASVTSSVKDNKNGFGNDATSLGIFGQYILASQPTDGGFGVHLGYATQSGDIGSGCSDDEDLKCSQLNFEEVLDVLGVYRTAEFGSGWNGLLMAGVSRMKAEAEVADNIISFGDDGVRGGGDDIDISGRKVSETHSGYKLAAGVQKNFGANVSMQALVNYADYGDESYEIAGSETKADLTSLGIRIGFAYHF